VVEIAEVDSAEAAEAVIEVEVATKVVTKAVTEVATEVVTKAVIKVATEIEADIKVVKAEAIARIKAEVATLKKLESRKAIKAKKRNQVLKAERNASPERKINIKKSPFSGLFFGYFYLGVIQCVVFRNLGFFILT
jgi:predicted double-glycine peptidase